jgi:hypothetical protein
LQLNDNIKEELHQKYSMENNDMYTRRKFTFIQICRYQNYDIITNIFEVMASQSEISQGKIYLYSNYAYNIMTSIGLAISTETSKICTMSFFKCINE